MGKVDLCIGVLHEISTCHRYSFQYLNALNVPTLLSNSCLSCLAGFYHPSASGTTTWWSRESQDQDQDQDPQLLQITTVNTPPYGCFVQRHPQCYSFESASTLATSKHRSLGPGASLEAISLNQISKRPQRPRRYSSRHTTGLRRRRQAGKGADLNS
jgi:hypothetical protein